MTSLFDLSAHGRIRATGEDRARLLHALSTNHVQQLQPGGGLYAFFLSAQGRILADAHILCFEDSLLLDTEPETRESLFRHIDHYIIADDVALDDETERTFSFGVEGDGAAQFLERLSVPLPEKPGAHIRWEGLEIAAVTASGAAGIRIYGPLERKGELWQRLLLRGAVPGSLHALRVEHFRPRYGEDITEKTLPQETGLPEALHFQKGCYLGQEIVERIRSRGHVNRMLAGLEFADEAGGAEEITSRNGRFAIAMLRVGVDVPGAVKRPVRGA